MSTARLLMIILTALIALAPPRLNAQSKEESAAEKVQRFYLDHAITGPKKSFTYYKEDHMIITDSLEIPVLEVDFSILNKFAKKPVPEGAVIVSCADMPDNCIKYIPEHDWRCLEVIRFKTDAERLRFIELAHDLKVSIGKK